MKISIKRYVMQALLKNLISMHTRITDHGNAKDAIKLSKYILKLIKNINNEILDMGPEHTENNSANPPDCSEDNIK